MPEMPDLSEFIEDSGATIDAAPVAYPSPEGEIGAVMVRIDGLDDAMALITPEGARGLAGRLLFAADVADEHDGTTSAS